MLFSKVFLITCKDHGEESQNLAVAKSIIDAQDYVSFREGRLIPPEEWKGKYGRWVCVLGDAQYVIQEILFVERN